MSEYNNENIFSKRLRAGKRRTYFFDVRTTKNNDYFVTLTESKKRYDGDGYDRHKIFLYKEDFNKFVDALNETINHVKTELMPDFDFDAFSHEEEGEHPQAAAHSTPPPAAAVPTPTEPSHAELKPTNFDEAEELETPIAQATSFTEKKQDENPSANDEAQTW
jgi:hypothetical protein